MSKKDWKKQLLRVKELADQHLGRAERTEVLSEDLLLLEKRVDLIRQACQATSKKVSPCMQGHGVETEKRLKKIPEYSLGNALYREAGSLGESTLMGGMMKMSGDAESQLARDLLDHELQVEMQVIQPLHTILEVDFPNLNRLRKHLTKVVLDYDTAKSRYQSSQRETQRGNLSTAKLESMRDEMEDAHNQVDLSKDQFATEMYSLVSREPEFSNTLLELVKAQASFHKKALETLERLVPLMQDHLENHHQMPVYGQALEDHLRRTKRDIAQVIEDCICALIEIGMDEEGLFRVAGATSMVKKLTAAFDAGTVEMTEYARDVHCIAGALKQYLRELPEPLLTYPLYSDWVQATHLPPEQRLQSLGNILEKMPKPNYNNLRYLIKFLQKVSENADVNKMSPSNIAIVIGPNLLWPPGDGGPTVMTTSAPTSIVDTLICNADWFFPGDVDYHKTGKGMAACTFASPKGRHNSATLNNALGMAHTALVAPLAAHEQSRDSSPDSTLDGCSLSNGFSRTSLDARLDNRSYTESESSSGFPGSSPSTTRQSSCAPESRSIEGEHRCCNTDLLGDGLSDTSSEAGRGSLGGVSGAVSSSRAVTPPKPPPPKGVHSDMYNTAFALHSLGDGASDYLSRVRTLWDGHLTNKRLSVGSTTNLKTGGGVGSGGGPDLDFSVTGSDTSGTPPGTLTSPPKGAQENNMSSSTGSSASSSLYVGHNSAVTDSNGPTSSPMTARKATKKHAPLPPSLMERPQVPAPPPPQGSTVGEHKRASSEGITISTAVDRPDATYSLDKPPIPGRPQVSPVPTLINTATGSRPDRPQGPPPDRPLGPPPEIPDRPTSPVERAEHVSSAPPRPGGPPPASPGQPPPIAAKPDSPSSLSSSIQQPQALPRSAKPPRPNPRPPPPPKHPFKLSESGCDPDELPKAAERKDSRTSVSEQTHL